MATQERDDSELRDDSVLRDDSINQGDNVAAQDQEQAAFRDEAQRGIDEIPTHDYNPSGIQKDNKVAGKNPVGKNSNAPAYGTTSNEMSRGQMAMNSIKAALGNKKAAKRLLAGGGLAGFAIVAFLGFSIYEIVHVEENIVHTFDKRVEHSLGKRIGMNGWKKVRDLANKNKPSSDIADPDRPLKNAYEEFDFSKMEADTGYKATFDEHGKWTGLVAPDGTKLSVSDEALKNIDSPAREVLSHRYPELGFFHESIRARNLDADYGVTRKFLDNPDEAGPPDGTSAKEDLDKKAEARVADTDTNSSKTKAEEDRAKANIEDAVNRVEGRGFGNFIRNHTPGFDEVAKICGVNGLAKALKDGLIAIRSAQEIRLAWIIVSTGDKLKTGHLKLAQLGVLMRELSGFSKSPSFQKITMDKNIRIPHKTQEKFAVDGGGTVVQIADMATSVGAVNATCKVVNGTIGLIAASVLAGIEAAQPELAGISDALIAAGGSYASATVVGKIAEELVKVAESAQKPVLDWTSSSAEDKVTGAIAGYDLYSNNSQRGNGGMKAHPGQIAAINAEIDHEEYQSTQTHSGALYAMFSPGFNQSITSRFLLRLPGTPYDLVTSTSSTVAAIFNPIRLSSIKSFTKLFSADAHADTPPTEADNDPAGMDVDQYFMPDWLLDKYPDSTDNEQWVIDYLATKGQRLYDAGTDPNNELLDKNDAHDDDYHDFVRDCLLSQDPDVYNQSKCDAPTGPDDTSGPQDAYNHFRVYRWDTGNGNYVQSNNNTKNDQNDPDAGGSATNPTAPIGGGAVTGDAKTAAQQILDLATQGKITIGDFSTDKAHDTADHSLASQQLADIAAGNAPHSTTRSCGSFTPPSSITPNPKILDFLADLGGSQHYTINVLFGQCHNSAGSQHYKGNAVDFDCNLDIAAADEVGRKYGVSRNFETCSAESHWHYSVGGQ